MNLKDMVKKAYSDGKFIFDIATQYNISTEEVLEILKITKFESLIKDEEISTRRYIKIQCIEERRNATNIIRKGEIGYADITSIYIDSDGDTFMKIYDRFGTEVGNCNMNRFRSVK